MMWYLFEISINILQVCFVTYFILSYLSESSINQFYKIKTIIFTIILFSLLTLSNIVTVFESFAYFLFIGYTFIYLMLFYKGRIVQKILATILPYTIILSVSALITNLISFIFETPIIDIFTKQSIYRFIGIITIQLCTIYLFKITLSILKKDKVKLNKNEITLILTVFFTSSTIFIFLFLTTMEHNLTDNQILFIIFSILGLIFINIIIYYMVLSLSKNNSAVNELNLLKLQQVNQSKYYIDIKNRYEEINKLHHDYKNNISIIYTMISENHNNEAINFIEKNISKIKKIKPFASTESIAINSVLNNKLNDAEQFNIEMKIATISKFKNIDEYDLCTLIGNMLDNSITACLSCSENNRIIKFKISAEESNNSIAYIISSMNSIPTSILNSNPNLITTKSDKKNHGYGMKIIKEIIKKYNGSFDCFEEDESFFINIILRV